MDSQKEPCHEEEPGEVGEGELSGGREPLTEGVRGGLEEELCGRQASPVSEDFTRQQQDECDDFLAPFRFGQ